MELVLRIVIWIVTAVVIGFVVNLVWNGLGLPPDGATFAMIAAVVVFIALEEMLWRTRRRAS